MTSYTIKHALMYYYRFNRQCLCATECMNSDVIVVSNNKILEIEIKTSKSDMWRGEAVKAKHKYMQNPKEYITRFMPHKFYMCVPDKLREEAFKWVEATNSKYGIITCTGDDYFPHNIFINKSASTIHKKELGKYTVRNIMMRVCSENVGLRERVIHGIINRRS